MIISLNGVDNSGKTTHARLLVASLGPCAQFLEGVHRYSDKWPNISGAALRNWWFKECPSDQLTTLLLSSFDSRNRSIQIDAKLILLDRGLPMIQATAAATSAIKDNISPHDALTLVRQISSSIVTNVAREDCRVLLLPAASIPESVSVTLEREGPFHDEVYARYQQVLNSILLLQQQDGEYDLILQCSDQSIVAVNNSIRSVLNTRGLDIPPLLSHVKHVYGFGGLSESGKSTAADYLRGRYSVGRLKLSYLLELAAVRHNIASIYGEPPHKIAEWLLLEIDAFARAHHFLQYLSIESLHSFDVTKSLKALLGDKFRIVFLDCPPDLRKSRAVPSDDVSARDQVKLQRGGATISSIADHTIYNDRDFAYLFARLDDIHIASMDHRTLATSRVAFPAPFGDVLEHVESVLITELQDKLALLATIGSVATDSR